MEEPPPKSMSDPDATTMAVERSAAECRVAEIRRLSGAAPNWRTMVKDPLTGLFSRDALLIFTEDAVSYFRRYARSVAILIVEIDGLQAIVETHRLPHGHDALRHVAEVLDLSVRKTDKVARFDSQRFVILLREISRADSLKLAHRMLRRVRDLGVRHRDQRISLTISIGAAIVAESDMTCEPLIGRAEAGLDAAQAAGGDQVVFLDAPPPIDC